MSELVDPSEYDTVEEFLPPLYVQLARIYDLMAVVALAQNEELAEEVLDLHEKGKFFGAPPALAADEDETEGTSFNE